MRNLSGVSPPLEITLNLARVIERHLAAQASGEVLLEACRSAMAELDRLRQAFKAHDRAQSPAVRGLLERERVAVFEAFEDSREQIQTCAAFAQAGESDWDYPLINLKLANSRLNLTLLRFRDCVLSERGPTAHPGVNHLLAVAGDRERFETLWEEEMIRARSALEELDQEYPLGAELYAFQLNYLSLLEERPLSSEKIGPWLGELKALAQSFVSLDLDYFARRFAAGPTSLTWLNLLIHGGWQVSRGTLDPRVVLRCVAVAKEQLQAMLGRHRIYMQGLEEGAPEMESAEHAEKLLQTLNEVVDSYADVAESRLEPPAHLVRQAQEVAQELDQVCEELWSLQNPLDFQGGATADTSGSLLDRLLEAGRAALEGGAGQVELRHLLGEARTILQRVLRQGELLPQRLSKQDLEQVHQLQKDYHEIVSRFGDALEFLDLLCDTPSRAAFEQAEVELTEAAGEVRAIFGKLRGLTH